MKSTARFLAAIFAVAVLGTVDRAAVRGTCADWWRRGPSGVSASTVSGRVMGTAGPAEGVQLRIERNAETSFCFGGQTDCDSERLTSSVSGSGGAFELVVPAELASLPAPKGFTVFAFSPACGGSVAGPRSTRHIDTLADHQAFPDILLWDRRPVITEDRGVLLVDTMPLPAASGPVGTDFVVDDGRSSPALWRTKARSMRD